MIDSLRLEQNKDRAIITATIPIELLRQLTSPDTGINPDAASGTPVQPAPASH
jgi:hypothetical protein